LGRTAHRDRAAVPPIFVGAGSGAAGARKRAGRWQRGSRSTRPRWCATTDKMGRPSLPPEIPHQLTWRERPAQDGSVARRRSEPFYDNGAAGQPKFLYVDVGESAVDDRIAFLRTEITGKMSKRWCRH
jgi:hypothetical protein